MSEVKLVKFQTKLEGFTFLGVENVLHETANFDEFWNHFFAQGGYDAIDPYALDPNCINLWYTRGTEAIYFQGKIVRSDAQVPAGYILAKFPAGEYMVVTTEWLASYEESMQHINHDYTQDLPLPDGYQRHSEEEEGIFLLERWGANTGEGFRYEFWIPIQKTK